MDSLTLRWPSYCWRYWFALPLHGRAKWCSFAYVRELHMPFILLQACLLMRHASSPDCPALPPGVAPDLTASFTTTVPTSPYGSPRDVRTAQGTT